jgi:hypothetical protein
VGDVFLFAYFVQFAVDVKDTSLTHHGAQQALLSGQWLSLIILLTVKLENSGDKDILIKSVKQKC